VDPKTFEVTFDGPRPGALSLLTRPSFIEHFSARYPALKPGATTGFDLIRTFAVNENSGKTMGTTTEES